MVDPGWVVILNGAPRSGKSSIARAMQERFEGVWMNLGVDVMMEATPPRLRPGIGLRPGGERPDLEEVVPTLFRALYESVAVHSRLGLNVVVDVGHHESYSKPLGILRDRDRCLTGLPVLLVGVQCPLETILERRSASPSANYVQASSDDPSPAPVALWQSEVHATCRYDLELDTSHLSPLDCAKAIGRHLGMA